MSLGIKTRYKEIFEKMKENNNDYEDIITENFDIEEFIGYCKKNINDTDNKYERFMKKYFHNKIKLDFMKAVTEIVSKEEKNIFQEKNESIYVLLKEFDTYFTLNYDPFLYQLLMTYKKSEDKTAVAFSNNFSLMKELMDTDTSHLFDIIDNAYISGKWSLYTPDQKKTMDLGNFGRAAFKQEINTLLDKKYSRQQINAALRQFWKFQDSKKNKKSIDIDDGFGLFGKDLLYQNSQTQNLFFLHGAFHIYKRGKSV